MHRIRRHRLPLALTMALLVQGIASADHLRGATLCEGPEKLDRNEPLAAGTNEGSFHRALDQPESYGASLLNHPRELPDGLDSHFYLLELAAGLTLSVTLTHSTNTFGLGIHMWDSQNQSPDGSPGDGTPTHCDRLIRPQIGTSSDAAFGTARQFLFPVDEPGQYVLEVFPHGPAGAIYQFEYALLPTDASAFP